MTHVSLMAGSIHIMQLIIKSDHWQTLWTVWTMNSTSKYDHCLSVLLHDELHWLDIRQRVQYKLAVANWPFTGVSGIKHRCTSPTTAFQSPTLLVAGTCDPPAAINWLFRFLQHLRLSFFASAGPTIWNSLPDNLRNPAVGPDQFRQNLKPHLFACC